MCSGITPASIQEDCGVAGTKPGSAVQGKHPPSVLLALWPCSQTCLQDLAGLRDNGSSDQNQMLGTLGK